MKEWFKRNYYRLFHYTQKEKIGQNLLLNIKNKLEGLDSICRNCNLATCYMRLGNYLSGNSATKHTVSGKFWSICSNVQTSLGLQPSKDIVAMHLALAPTQKQAGFSFMDYWDVEKIKANIPLFNNIELFTSSVK